MKHPFFALSVCLVLFFGACGQAGDSSSDLAGDTTSSDSKQNIVVSNEKPASEPNKLNEQVATDLLAAFALERTIRPAYNESMELMTSIRPLMQAADDAKREELKKLVSDAVKIRNTFEEHQAYSSRLDSLTFRIAGNKLSIEDAQREYLETRNALKTIESRISKELDLLKKVKETIQKDYPSSNNAQ